jgi:hypothetical protein
MLALTLLQRALLPERPAFFVTAGQRGGGKTTLVLMIMMAILGRRAAAASWSDNVEERKKALFSYMRQCVAALVWDNIARGATISCPHIEAALTAAEISDRVLGVSRVERVPSSTIQIFTGNSIAPRGDMASRSFLLPLNVNRPDPENRTFAHADPLAWTQANRARILRALYTILIGGALQRPQHQVAKTRFKIWWGLIGWPVEYAAGLLGIEVDCAELLRAGEFAEEEASAASRALTVMEEFWGDKPFTTRDVVLALADLNSLVEDCAARAEALSDALGELVGKVLEKPTARSIGKLFQKHLTNRLLGSRTETPWRFCARFLAMPRTNTGSMFQSRGNPAARTSLNRLPAVRRPPTPTFPTWMKARLLIRGKRGKRGMFRPRSARRKV